MKILFLGDFLYDYDDINSDIIELSNYIKKNNLVTILNLEGSYKSKNKLNKSVNLANSNKLMAVLNLLNVIAVNLANNHILDYGEDGLNSLKKDLDQNGINYFGVGDNLNDSLKPYIYEFNQKKYAFFGFGWKMEECINAKKNKIGTCPLDFKLINQCFNNCECDYIIPSFHFGYEFEKLPQPYHVKMCRYLVKNKKVKAIIGHHPHIVQAYDKKYNIFYSLGNSYFGTMRKRYTKDFKYYPYVNQGIGVILDLNNFQSKIIHLVSYNEITKINHQEKIYNLVDISNIDTNNYSEYFKKKNNTINKKYIYQIGFIYEKLINKTHYLRRILYKLYLRKIKWPLIKIIKKLLRKEKKNER